MNFSNFVAVPTVPDQEAEVTRKLNSSKESINVVISLLLFAAAGIAEIGGGYLVWKGVREKVKPRLFVPLGSIALIAYGFIPTLQPMNSFGRLYAIYGGFFIVLSYVWAYLFDGTVVDMGDILGSSIAIVGVLVCWFWPR